MREGMADTGARSGGIGTTSDIGSLCAKFIGVGKTAMMQPGWQQICPTP